MQTLNVFLSLISLIILEIILGIDNLVFLSILTEKLPEEQRSSARKVGLLFAWVTRLLLLASAVWLVKFTKPFFTYGEFSLSIHNLFLLFGGLFLIAKATQEIRFEVGESDTELVSTGTRAITFKVVVLQVALMDIIFSL